MRNNSHCLNCGALIQPELEKCPYCGTSYKLFKVEDKIEFISYDGRYPNLCSGTLIIKVGDVKYSFGWNAEYRPFWVTGGSCEFSDDWADAYVGTAPWEFELFGELPERLKGREQELIDCFNENVEYGCCGGCI